MGFLERDSNKFFLVDPLYSSKSSMGSENKNNVELILKSMDLPEPLEFFYIRGTQNDSINCGVFALTYMECWLYKLPFKDHDGLLLERGQVVVERAEDFNINLQRRKFCELMHREVHKQERGDREGALCGLCPSIFQENPR